MIYSDVLLGSQDILDDSSWGPQKRFFGFSFGGYPEGGEASLVPQFINRELQSFSFPFFNERENKKQRSFLYGEFNVSESFQFSIEQENIRKKENSFTKRKITFLSATIVVLRRH